MNSSYMKLDWILVLHYPDDVITISPSSPPDLELDADFSQLQAEEILQLIKNMKHTHTRHTR